MRRKGPWKVIESSSSSRASTIALCPHHLLSDEAASFGPAYRRSAVSQAALTALRDSRRQSACRSSCSRRSAAPVPPPAAGGARCPAPHSAEFSATATAWYTPRFRRLEADQVLRLAFPDHSQPPHAHHRGQPDRSDRRRCLSPTKTSPKPWRGHVLAIRPSPMQLRPNQPRSRLRRAVRHNRTPSASSNPRTALRASPDSISPSSAEIVNAGTWRGKTPSLASAFGFVRHSAHHRPCRRVAYNTADLDVLLRRHVPLDELPSVGLRQDLAGVRTWPGVSNVSSFRKCSASSSTCWLPV
jgi:hypothetical protein